MEDQAEGDPLFHAEGDATAVGFNLEDADLDHIADLQNGIGRHLGAMQQPILLDAYIHESTKIHHVAHGAFQAHPHSQVFHFKHIGAKNGGGCMPGAGHDPVAATARGYPEGGYTRCQSPWQVFDWLFWSASSLTLRSAGGSLAGCRQNLEQHRQSCVHER